MLSRLLESQKTRWALSLLIALAPASALASVCFINVSSCPWVTPNQWFQDVDAGANQDVNRCAQRATEWRNACISASASSSYYDDAGNNTYTGSNFTPPTPAFTGGGWASYTTFDLPVNQPFGAGAMSLILQGDGNLVISKNGAPVWYSGSTHDCGNCHLSFQGDGNLVIYDGNSVVWDAGATVAQIDGIQINEKLPYFLMHSARANIWAVVPNGNISLPDGTVLNGTLSFR